MKIEVDSIAFEVDGLGKISQFAHFVLFLSSSVSPPSSSAALAGTLAILAVGKPKAEASCEIGAPLVAIATVVRLLRRPVHLVFGWSSCSIQGKMKLTWSHNFCGCWLGWDLDEIWMTFGWDLDEIWMRFGWDLDEIWMRFGWDLDEIWMRFGWDLNEIWMRFGWNLDEIWLRFGWDLDEIWIRFGWDLDEIWLRCYRLWLSFWRGTTVTGSTRFWANHSFQNKWSVF